MEKNAKFLLYGKVAHDDKGTPTMQVLKETWVAATTLWPCLFTYHFGHQRRWISFA